jgi:hypothetical protein
LVVVIAIEEKPESVDVDVYIRPTSSVRQRTHFGSIEIEWQ